MEPAWNLNPQALAAALQQQQDLPSQIPGTPPQAPVPQEDTVLEKLKRQFMSGGPSDLRNISSSIPQVGGGAKLGGAIMSKLFGPAGGAAAPALAMAAGQRGSIDPRLAVGAGVLAGGLGLGVPAAKNLMAEKPNVVDEVVKEGGYVGLPWVEQARAAANNPRMLQEMMATGTLPEPVYQEIVARRAKR